jgi:hypothetical protein
MELRSYQIEALQALFDYWRRGGGNPLLAKGDRHRQEGRHRISAQAAPVRIS